MTIEGKTIWAVEWNPKTRTSNVRTLSETIEGNIHRILEDGELAQNNWHLFGIAESAEVANLLATALEKRLN